jgi:hypothetical protein
MGAREMAGDGGGLRGSEASGTVEEVTTSRLSSLEVRKEGVWTVEGREMGGGRR